MVASPFDPGSGLRGFDATLSNITVMQAPGKASNGTSTFVSPDLGQKMNDIAGKTEELSSELFSKVGHYRHKVFIESLGWDLKTSSGLELDQFDRPDTLYVVSQDEQNQVNGCFQ